MSPPPVAAELPGHFRDAAVVFLSAFPGSLPVVLGPATAGIDVADWVGANRAVLDAVLRRAGGLLFRGFDTGRIEAFSGLANVLIERHMDYAFALTPRRRITDTVATSTELPSHVVIPLHGECSAQRDWPMTLMFWCKRPAAAGGETPLADSRRIHDRLPAPIRDRFAALGVRYVRHIRGRAEIERVFGTSSRSPIAEYCERNRYAVAFDGEERVRTEHVGPAILEHPVTGERVWFNLIETYHLASLPLTVVRRNLPVDGDVLPLEVSYGDGSPIDNDVARVIRRAVLAETVAFPWQSGDVLVLDNMLALHGRRAFTGDRRVLVAMGDSYLEGLSAGRA